MTDLVRSEAKQEMAQDPTLAPRQEDRAVPPPLWLALLGRWTATATLNPPRRSRDLTAEHDSAAFAAG